MLLTPARRGHYGVTARLLLSIGVAAALMGLPSLREAEAQRPAQVTDGAYRGYLAVRLSGGGQYEVIDELNADRLFVPASWTPTWIVARCGGFLPPSTNGGGTSTSSASRARSSSWVLPSCNIFRLV